MRNDYFEQKTIRWDRYFHSICEAVASKSPCMSRKIGAILVRDNSIVSTGYNGPARGIPHCGHERFEHDDTLSFAASTKEFDELGFRSMIGTTCPRKLMGFESGTHMEFCIAQHAEENCISNAARLGTSTLGTTLYMNCVVPCKNCYSTLINAGIVEIVVDSNAFYDNHTAFIHSNANIHLREFRL